MTINADTYKRGKPCTASVNASAKTSSDSSSHILTQQELMAWWPFTRLEPSRFPKTQKAPKYPEGEDALL
jgi:hypothetical protein